MSGSVGVLSSLVQDKNARERMIAALILEHNILGLILSKGLPYDAL
jgi:hypothetical protein